VEGSVRFASSDGSNFSSSSMFAALGAVPRVARDFVSSEADDFELEVLERVDLDFGFGRELLAGVDPDVELLARVLFGLDALPLERLVFELREPDLPEPELREPEDLELPSDLLCAIPPATIPPVSWRRVSSRLVQGGPFNWIKSDPDYPDR
jgi:hypothetical protein